MFRFAVDVGGAARAAFIRQSGGIDESLMTSNRKSSGDSSGLQVAAAKAVFTSAVVLLGVPGWRPPRLSPGLDPLGIATFATLCPTLEMLALGCVVAAAGNRSRFYFEDFLWACPRDSTVVT